MISTPDSPSSTFPGTETTGTLATARSAEWVLCLLYAPVNGHAGKPVVGKRRLWSGLLIAADNIKQKTSVTLPVDFNQDKWGVTVDDFDEIVAFLSDNGLVRVGPHEQLPHLSLGSAFARADFESSRNTPTDR